MSETHCQICKHPKIMHRQDGIATYCLPCIIAHRENPTLKICRQRFNFLLSDAERVQAALHVKDAYPQWSICGNCGDYWIQHMGMLCGSGDSTFVLFIDCDTGGGLIQ